MATSASIIRDKLIEHLGAARALMAHLKSSNRESLTPDVAKILEEEIPRTIELMEKFAGVHFKGED